MRPEPNIVVEEWRAVHPVLGASPAGSNMGYFEVPSPVARRALLRVISSGSGSSEDNRGWEHVSVSTSHRCPVWEEMAFVKKMFWLPDETVLQFHPKQEKYINCHPFVLHLWKKAGVDHALPPEYLI